MEVKYKDIDSERTENYTLIKKQKLINEIKNANALLTAV